MVGAAADRKCDLVSTGGGAATCPRVSGFGSAALRYIKMTHVIKRSVLSVAECQRIRSQPVMAITAYFSHRLASRLNCGRTQFGIKGTSFTFYYARVNYSCILGNVCFSLVATGGRSIRILLHVRACLRDFTNT